MRLCSSSACLASAVADCFKGICSTPSLKFAHRCPSLPATSMDTGFIFVFKLSLSHAG